jgi:hypothetical protein
MSEIPPPAETPTKVLFHVCTSHFTITTEDEGADHELYGWFQESRPLIEARVNDLVKQHLGEEFWAQGMTINEGSVEIVFSVIGIVGIAYDLISKFRDFRDSINLLNSDIQKMLERFLTASTPTQATVKGGWIPGAEVSQLAGTHSDTGHWIVRIWNRLLDAEIGYSNFGLLLAQVSFSVVSGFTTFYGFRLLLDSRLLSLLATLGIQSMVFWLPRRLHAQKRGRLAVDAISFLLSVMISIIFSYQAFFNILVPKEVREKRSTYDAFTVVEPAINTAITVLTAAVTRTQTNVEEFKRSAERELSTGGSKPGINSSPGKGPIYNEWQAMMDNEAAKLNSLQAMLNQAVVNQTTIRDLQNSSVVSEKKRSDLKFYANHILTLGKNPEVLAVVEGSDANLAKQMRDLTLPPIDTGENVTGSAEVKEQFMRGMATITEAVNEFLARKRLEEFHIGAVLALFIATFLDLLILISGLVSSTQRVPRSYRRLIPIFLTNRSLKVGRTKGGRLAVLLRRDNSGIATQLTRSQDLAAQALLEGGYLKLVKEGEPGTKKANELLVVDKSALPYFIDEGIM